MLVGVKVSEYPPIELPPAITEAGLERVEVATSMTHHPSRILHKAEIVIVRTSALTHKSKIIIPYIKFY